MENKAAWKECFSVRGIRLPTGYYFGITAATGDLSDIHDVLSVRLYELDVPNDVSKMMPFSKFFALLSIFFYCGLVLQGKDNEDRSQIVPQASYFEPPRGKDWSLCEVLLLFWIVVGVILFFDVLQFFCCRSCRRSKAIIFEWGENVSSNDGWGYCYHSMRCFQHYVLSKASRKHKKAILLILLGCCYLALTYSTHEDALFCCQVSSRLIRASPIECLCDFNGVF